VDKNSKMDIEKRQINDEWHNNQPDASGDEMSTEVILYGKSTNSSFANGVRLTMGWPFLISRRSQRSIKTAMPIVRTVRTPLTFEPQVQAMKTPVAISHVHHSGENSLL
jgi:hypothetical protein